MKNIALVGHIPLNSLVVTDPHVFRVREINIDPQIQLANREWMGLQN